MTAAVLLAAGASSRTSTPKQLFAVGCEPLVRHQARRLREAGAARVYVVTGHHAAAVGAALAGLAGVRTVENPQGEMFDSLLAGVKAALADGAARVVIHPVDVPLPSLRALARLLDARGTVVLPTCGGKRGHPVVMARAAALTLGEGARRLDAWLTEHAVLRVTVELGEACILCNANTDAELQAYFTGEQQ